MLTGLRKRAKRYKGMVVVCALLEDMFAAVRLRCGNTCNRSGATHSKKTVAESLTHIDSIFDAYLSYGQMERAQLRGLRILEVGPGDNLGVALRFIESGAACVVSIDRFEAVRDHQAESAVYAALVGRSTGSGRERLLRLVDSGGHWVPGQRDLVRIEGIGAEHASTVLPARGFDLIVSAAVLEHVEDLPRVIRELDGLLAVGGSSVHIVDLSDHGMFSSGGMHPLTFLTIRSGSWQLMSRHSGKPNRWRIGTYLDEWQRLNTALTVTLTSVLGSPQLNGSRLGEIAAVPLSAQSGFMVGQVSSRLALPFRGLSVQELAVCGFAVLCRKRS